MTQHSEVKCLKIVLLSKVNLLSITDLKTDVSFLLYISTAEAIFIFITLYRRYHPPCARGGLN